MHISISWDPQKARRNKAKHGIDFCDLEAVFFDSYAISIEDPDAAGEQRWIRVGMDAVGRLVVVAYTYRDNAIRIISARTATARERKAYAQRI